MSWLLCSLECVYSFVEWAAHCVLEIGSVHCGVDTIANDVLLQLLLSRVCASGSLQANESEVSPLGQSSRSRSADVPLVSRRPGGFALFWKRSSEVRVVVRLRLESSHFPGRGSHVRSWSSRRRRQRLSVRTTCPTWAPIPTCARVSSSRRVSDNEM